METFFVSNSLISWEDSDKGHPWGNTMLLQEVCLLNAINCYNASTVSCCLQTVSVNYMSDNMSHSHCWLAHSKPIQYVLLSYLIEIRIQFCQYFLALEHLVIWLLEFQSWSGKLPKRIVILWFI